MSRDKYRLVTRADFDGLVCAALLKELDMIDEIKFAHPKDVADGRVEITGRDITTNLPYDPRCHLAFDHHVSETLRHGDRLPANLVLDDEADSAARVVYRHFGGRKRFPSICSRMMVAVDKADAARFTEEEILDPDGWVLLNFIMDPRTGLGRFGSFRISNWELLEQLIDHCRTLSVGEILSLPDVKERIVMYFDHAELAVAQIRRCARVEGKAVMLDLRGEETIYVCNRFMVYALFPEAEVSIHVLWGRGALSTVFAIGKSILNRESTVNVGELCMRFGGGGHAAAGTCQVDHSEAEMVQRQLLAALNGESIQAPQQEPPEESMDDEELRAAESMLFDTMAENGMQVIASKRDIDAIHQRLERLEQLISELIPARTH